MPHLFESTVAPLCTEGFNNQQDRQCAHNVTLWLLRVTTVTVEKQQVLQILSVCVQLWLFSKAIVPYYTVISGMPARTHFSTLFHKRHDFQEKLLNMKYVLIFPATFARNTSHFPNKS
jgi:hypothetical protein